MSPTQEGARSAQEGARSAQRLLLQDADAVDLAQQVSMTATWAWLPGPDLVVWSPNLFRLLGHEPDAFQPTQERFLEQVHALDLGHVARLRPASYPTECRVVRADGAIRFFRSTPPLHLPEADGLEERWVGVIQDLTEAHRSNATLRAHETVAESLADWTSLRDDGEQLLRRIAELLRCFRAALYVERGPVLLPVVLWDDAHDRSALDDLLEVEVVPGTGLTGSSWSERQPICVPDLQEDTADTPWRSLADGASIRGFLALPLTTDHTVLAVASFASHDVLDISPGELQSLAALAHLIGRFFEKRPGELAIALLSERERQLLQLAAEGLQGQEIAAALHISTETVKSHFKRVYAKLQVSDRAAAVAQAMRRGLID